VGNVFPSWKVLVSALRNQLYHLGYKEKDFFEWKGLKLRKGQTMQEYIAGFHKMALMLDILLHTQETLLKYIGGYLHIFVTLYLCLDLLILMRFFFKQQTLRQGKQELVYPRNCLQEKRIEGSGMARKQIQ
jgi:hypothetical protein